MHDIQFPRALMPPLELATLKAVTPSQFHVDIWDESIRGPLPENGQPGNDYDLIGVTGYNLHIPWALGIAEIARRRGIPAVIGGPGVSGSPDTCRDVFDVVFIGEAEHTWPQFLQDWEAGCHRPEYRQVQRPDIQDAMAPDWTGFEHMSKDYLLGAVQTTRGCPFDCEFCDVIHLFGRQPRHKSIDTILAEVAAMERMGMRIIFFCDDNFIGRPQYAKDLLKRLIPLNNSFDRPLGFTTQMTVNVAEDDELMELLADANFHWVLIGIESPREASLREANKPQNYRVNLIEALRKIQSYGVLVKGAMIVGFDHDDTDIFDEIYEFLRKCGVLINGLSMLHAYPGTPLLARLQKEGRIIEMDDDMHWEHSRPMTNIIPKQMTRVELFKGYKRLIERIRSWEFFSACAADMLQNIQRVPKLPKKAAVDPSKAAVLQSALKLLNEKDRAVVVGVLQAVWQQAPFMMERMVSALFRFGGTAAGLENLSRVLQERIDLELREDYRPRIVRTMPPVPPRFKNSIQWDAFPTTYHRLMAELNDRSLVTEGLIRVWKSFLIRWGESFERIEDYHHEYLRELCDRTIEEGNTGQFSEARINADVEGLSRGQLRRLAGEVLVSVEQDLRGVPPSETVAIGAGTHETVGH